MERVYGKIRVIMICMALAGCSGKEEQPENPGDILIELDGEALTLREVETRIPAGISVSDSVAMSRRIIDKWIEDRILCELAEAKLPNIEEIDRKVADYRNRMIATEYLKRVKEERKTKVEDKDVRSFYESHKGELKTEIPLVKGVYVKMPTGSSHETEIRSLVFEGTEESIDRLEKLMVGDAVQYDYFGNTWVDWQTIADQIPYRFYDADAFIEKNKNFETNYNGSTYLLHISDYIPTGSEQPYEFASRWITSMLEQSQMASYEANLVESLVKKSISEGRLVKVGYDPLLHARLKRVSEKRTKEKDEKK